LNGLKVAIKQLRAGTCDIDVAEQLLLEEAALMQVPPTSIQIQSARLLSLAHSGSITLLYCTSLDACGELGSRCKW
jgi:hypothetical protein